MVKMVHKNKMVEMNVKHHIKNTCRIRIVGNLLQHKSLRYFPYPTGIRDRITEEEEEEKNV